jgi:hypothetical protein
MWLAFTLVIRGPTKHALDESSIIAGTHNAELIRTRL